MDALHWVVSYANSHTVQNLHENSLSQQNNLRQAKACLVNHLSDMRSEKLFRKQRSTYPTKWPSGS